MAPDSVAVSADTAAAALVRSQIDSALAAEIAAQGVSTPPSRGAVSSGAVGARAPSSPWAGVFVVLVLVALWVVLRARIRGARQDPPAAPTPEKPEAPAEEDDWRRRLAAMRPKPTPVTLPPHVAAMLMRSESCLRGEAGGHARAPFLDAGATPTDPEADAPPPTGSGLAGIDVWVEG